VLDGPALRNIRQVGTQSREKHAQAEREQRESLRTIAPRRPNGDSPAEPEPYAGPLQQLSKCAVIPRQSIEVLISLQ